MRRLFLIVVTGLFFPAAGAIDIKAQESSPNDMRVYWKEGLRLDSSDGNFKLKIGGRLMNDWGWLTEDEKIRRSFGRLEDGVEFRRARLYSSGTIYGAGIYKLQVDFATGEVSFKDVYLGIKGLGTLGQLTIGQFKEPFSLEELTSSNYTTFMERSLINTFAPARKTGMMINSAVMGERSTWAVGIFRPTSGVGKMAGDAGYSFTGRMTHQVPLDDSGKGLIHLGIAGSHRNLAEPRLLFQARPEHHLSSRFLNTQYFPSTYYRLLGAEAALVLNRLSLQGEYVLTNSEYSPGDDPSFYGYYLEGSYFLTGDSRPYDSSKGVFSRVKPKEPLGESGGIGALQLTARYSSLDLNDGEVSGGEMGTITLGLNWHLNPNMRCMVNFIRAMIKDGGSANMLGIRYQVDF
jgi:phosphate-selective porin OprO/OprP